MDEEAAVATLEVAAVVEVKIVEAVVEVAAVEEVKIVREEYIIVCFIFHTIAAVIHHMLRYPN